MEKVTTPAATRESALAENEMNCMAFAVVAILHWAILVVSPVRGQSGVYTLNGGTAN